MLNKSYLGKESFTITITGFTFLRFKKSITCQSQAEPKKVVNETDYLFSHIIFMNYDLYV